MPFIKCLVDGCEGKLIPTGVEREIETVTGRVIPELRHYQCSKCSREWTYNVLWDEWT